MKRYCLMLLLAMLLMVGCTADDTPTVDERDEMECAHVASVVEGIAPTCEEDGRSDGTVCSLCGTFLEASVLLPATGHEYKDYSCTACGVWRPSEGLLFESNGDGTCTLVGRGNCLDDYICIPAVSPDGERVTHIGEAVFSGHRLPGIYLSDGIEVIGAEAFSCMERLRVLRLPDTLVSIGKGAFRKCPELTSVSIPGGVKKIPENAFYDCSALEQVVIAQGVTELGDYAFRNCHKLRRADLPQTVRSIGTEAFHSCWALERMDIPEGVTIIAPYTFFHCMSLEEVTLPKTLREIGIGAFDTCTALREIEIPEGVSNIGVHAFFACASLKSIVLPEGITMLEGFNQCRSLEWAHIPASVTRVVNGTFDDCPLFREICYAGTQGQWQAIQMDRTASSNRILLDATMNYECDGDHP